MRHLSSRIASTVDRLIAGAGMGLQFHHEWPTGRLDAWHDSDGAFTLHLWRFEFICDRGLRWAPRG